jgi:hypothetical protein
MRRRETGDGRRETGDGRRETGDGRQETGDGSKPHQGFALAIESGLNAGTT